MTLLKNIFLMIYIVPIFVYCSSRQTVEINQKFIKSALDGDIEQLTSLLKEQKADINAQDKQGMTALMHASVKGHSEIVELLLNLKANTEISDEYEFTALILASTNGHANIVELLLNANASIYARNEDGRTALDFAKAKGDLIIVDLINYYPQYRNYKINYIESLKKETYIIPDCWNLIINYCIKSFNEFLEEHKKAEAIS